MTRTLLAALALVSAFTNDAWATECPQFYAGDQPPALVTAQPNDVELCKSAYVVLWSPDTREPVYAAEHLQKDGLEKAKHVKRTGSFHVEPGVPRGLWVTNDDYGEGYDKGHMAAEHDMPNAAAAHESFSYANAVPQDSGNNRGPWAHIEAQVRAMVLAAPSGEGWVLTGPVFDAKPPVTGETHIPVPAKLFKAIYIPGTADTPPVVGAWIALNAAEPKTRFVSLDTLAAATGFDPFPSLSRTLHTMAVLPAPAAKRTGVAQTAN